MESTLGETGKAFQPYASWSGGEFGGIGFRAGARQEQKRTGNEVHKKGSKTEQRGGQGRWGT